MIKINLLPHEPPRDHKLTLQIIGSIVVIIACILVITGFSLYFDNQIKDKNEEIRTKEDTVRQLNVIIESVLAYERDRDLLQEKLSTIAQLQKNQTGPVKLLEEIVKSLPDQVWLTSLQNTNVNVMLRGFSLSWTAVGDFMTALTNSPTFNSVEIRNVREIKVSGEEVHQFELSFVCNLFG